jgi:hypothetical protein
VVAGARGEETAETSPAGVGSAAAEEGGGRGSGARTGEGHKVDRGGGRLGWGR